MTESFFTGNPVFFQEVEDARQEIFEIFLMEGGNNGDAIVNPDSVNEQDFNDWLECQ